jgi:hypothetical protein
LNDNHEIQPENVKQQPSFKHGVKQVPNLEIQDGGSRQLGIQKFL